MHTIKRTEGTLLLLNEKTVYSSWQRSAFEGKNGILKQEFIMQESKNFIASVMH